MRAMIVDDEASRPQIETIQKILRDEFHLVVDEPYLFLAKYGKNEFCGFVEKLDEPPDIAIIDYFLDFKAGQETWHGGEVARFLRQHWKDKKPFFILFVSAYPQRAEGRYETLVGLFGDHPLTHFLELSGDWETRFRNVVRVYLEWVRGEARREIGQAIESLGEDEFNQILGEYKGRVFAVTEIANLIRKVAPSDSAVLIRGESGTGKELIARAIHYGSKRADKPFVAIHCAALAENLRESELFGHVKGAFTGAHKDKVGRFELAHGGTVFLDEIGEICPAIQVKLLRVLQEKKYERVGDAETKEANVRIIAATNQDLEKMIRQGTFRQDLYYRLNVLPIRLPPLRELGDDILYLADHFLRKHGRPDLQFTTDAQKWLREYGWPGNARQLENFMERATLLVEREAITAATLKNLHAMEVGIEDATAPKCLEDIYNLKWHEASKALERLYWGSRMDRFGWNITQAAEASGIARNNLSKKLKDLGLSSQ